MEIVVRLYHGLNKYLPPGDGGYARTVTVPKGATAANVLRDLGVPRMEGVVLFVKGQAVGWDHILEPGDVLAAMLPAGGG
jgi:sulfur carrier protein ThiS